MFVIFSTPWSLIESWLLFMMMTMMAAVVVMASP